MGFWVKNTSGRKDAMLTFSVMGVLTVLFKFLAAGVTITVMGKSFTGGTIDGVTVAAILTPTLGSYVARRYTDVKYMTGLGVVPAAAPSGALPDVPEPTPGSGA